MLLILFISFFCNWKRLVYCCCRFLSLLYVQIYNFRSRAGELLPVWHIRFVSLISNAQALYCSPVLMVIFGNVDTYSIKPCPPLLLLLEFRYDFSSSNNFTFDWPFTVTNVMTSPLSFPSPFTVRIILKISCFWILFLILHRFVLLLDYFLARKLLKITLLLQMQFPGLAIGEKECTWKGTNSIRASNIYDLMGKSSLYFSQLI